MPGDGGHLEAIWLLPFAAAVSPSVHSGRFSLSNGSSSWFGFGGRQSRLAANALNRSTSAWARVVTRLSVSSF